MNDKRTFMSSLSTRKSLKIIGYSKADMKRNDIPEINMRLISGKGL